MDGQTDARAHSRKQTAGTELALCCLSERRGAIKQRKSQAAVHLRVEGEGKKPNPHCFKRRLLKQTLKQKAAMLKRCFNCSGCFKPLHPFFKLLCLQNG